MSESNLAKPKTVSAKSMIMIPPNSIGGHKIESCDHCLFAAVDFVLLVAVVCALGCLMFPYAKVVLLSCVGIFKLGLSLVKEEISHAPALYWSLALGITVSGLLASLMLLLCSGSKCGRPDCKGLRKAAAFDVRVETEEALSGLKLKEGMTRFRHEHIRLLEAHLRRLAPENGKAVLVYRARCGCYAGRLEVAGPGSPVTPRGKLKR